MRGAPPHRRRSHARPRTRPRARRYRPFAPPRFDRLTGLRWPGNATTVSRNGVYRARRMPHRTPPQTRITARTSVRPSLLRDCFPNEQHNHLCPSSVQRSRASIRPRCVARRNRVSVAAMADIGEPVRVTESDVERLAAQVGLAIAPESRSAVAQHLTALLAAVRLIDELTLPGATEPAPRFEP